MSTFRTRKNVMLKVYSAMLIPALLLGGLGRRCMAEEPDAERSKLSGPIDGSWICQVTNVSSPENSFTALISFAAGGVFLASGSTNQANHPNPTSPLYGTWKRKGHNRYAATTHLFSFDPVTKEANFMIKLVQAFKLIGPDEFVGVDEFSLCDVQGQNCQSMPAANSTYKGTRIVPQDVTDVSLP